MNISLLLHNVRSAHNVGTILRTADGAGVSEVILAGYTPDPIDRFGRKRADVAKAALGAEESVLWRHSEDAVQYCRTRRQEGVQIIVLEQTAQSIPYTTYKPADADTAVLLVVGNEREGVPQELCDVADVCIEIPMHGMKESLNVAVATGIALFAVRDH